MPLCICSRYGTCASSGANDLAWAQVIKASNCDKPIFQLSIHRSSHAKHFRELVFTNAATPTAVRWALFLLSPTAAPNLSRLSISEKAASQALALAIGSAADVGLAKDQTLSRNDFQALAGQVLRLHLHNFSHADAATLLDYFPQLESLGIVGRGYSKTHDEAMAKALARRRLISFEVNLDARVTPGVDARWLSDDWLSIGSLRSQTLGGSATEALTFSTPFPRLRTLLLHANVPATIAILSFLTTASPLESVDIVMPNEGADALTFRSPLFVVLEGLGTSLHHLHCGCCDGDIFDRVSTTALRDFCDEWRVRLSAPAFTSYAGCIDYSNHDDPRTAETQGISSSVEEVLSFGLDRIRACRGTNDLEGASQMLEQTKGLKGLQQLWKD